MTRKALRKRLRTQANQTRPTSNSRGASPLMSVGVLLASAALTTGQATTAAAAELNVRGVGYAAGRRAQLGRTFDLLPEFSDSRLDVIHELLTYSAPIVDARRPGAFRGLGASQEPPARRFDIPPGPLVDVLNRFAQTTGVMVTLSIESIGTIQSPGVTGLLTIERALDAMLAGTSVTFRFTSPNAAVLELRAPTESVDVTARAPTAVVSSPKYTAPLREIPQTIEVIPRQVIEQQGVTTLSDALRNVPGITLQAGEGGGASNTAGDMFNLRGFNAANSLFVDGVRDDGLIARDVFNLEQIEVFMGPTGTDVGRGTAAGYVNLQTKNPQLSAGASALFSYGSADQKRLTLDFNRALPLGRAGSWLSRSAFRLNGLWQESGVPGRDVVTQGRRAVAPSLGLGLDTPTRVTLAAQVMRQDNIPDYGIPGAAWLDTPLTPTTVQAPRPVDSSNYYGSIGYDYDTGRQDSYTARAEHDFSPFVTVRNQTRYNRAQREAVITTIQNVAAYDPATNKVTLARQGNERENTIISNQTTAVARFSTGRLRHASSFGVEYSSEEQVAPALTGVGTRAPADIFAPNPHDPVAGYAPAPSGASTTGRTSTIGLFAFDTLDLGARWQVNGGLRTEHYATSFRSVDAAGVATADLSSSDVLLSGKAGVLFKAARTGNVYASYGTMVTPPGTANFTLSAQPNNQNSPNVKPQESTNYEVGSKWDFANGRLSLNTAIFRTENRNVIFTVDATAIPPIYNQDDSQRVNGLSIGAIGRITSEWDVLANVAYLDSALDTQIDANRGKRLTLTPKYSASFWTAYRLPIKLTIGGGIRGTDKVYINSANTIQSPGYQVVDGLVAYEVNTNLTLRLNLSNLTDERYIRNVNNNGGRYNPGQPRALLLTSSVTF
jgi:catecholate siderophore receptor